MQDKNNSKIYSFTDLVVWKESHKLVLAIYKITHSFPAEEKFGLSDQIKRAAVSISSCIAEGFARSSSKDKLNFYRISQGSLMELQNQLIIAKDLKYISQESFDKIAEQTIIVSKLLNGIIKSAKLKKYE